MLTINTIMSGLPASVFCWAVCEGGRLLCGCVLFHALSYAYMGVDVSLGGGERGAITFLLPDLNVIFSLENRGISLARISSSSFFSLLLE